MENIRLSSQERILRKTMTRRLHYRRGSREGVYRRSAPVSPEELPSRRTGGESLIISPGLQNSNFNIYTILILVWTSQKVLLVLSIKHFINSVLLTTYWYIKVQCYSLISYNRWSLDHWSVTMTKPAIITIIFRANLLLSLTDWEYKTGNWSSIKYL